MNDLKAKDGDCDDCRYAIYDYEYVVNAQGTEPSYRSRLFLTLWCPDSAKIKKKMVYSASFDSLKKSFTGVQKVIQVCSTAVGVTRMTAPLLGTEISVMRPLFVGLFHEHLKIMLLNAFFQIALIMKRDKIIMYFKPKSTLKCPKFEISLICYEWKGAARYLHRFWRCLKLNEWPRSSNFDDFRVIGPGLTVTLSVH